MRRPPPDAVAACCSALYGHPVAELLVGESFHPGGLTSTRALLDAARLPAAARILDIGCGLGASARVATTEYELQVDALDVSPAVIERARARPGAGAIAWHEADLRVLPFPDGTFDAVLCECVLSTAPRDAALAEIVRVLRQGGSLILSDVRNAGRAIDGLDDHALLGAALCVNEAWQPGELADTLMRHGLVIRREWDRSQDVLRLIERIEGRMLIAASVARQVEVPIAGIEGMDVSEARRLATAVRAAVGSGSLGYFAALIGGPSDRKADVAAP